MESDFRKIGNSMSAREYIKDKKIHELFQSLTVSLLYHRPHDPAAFIEEALNDKPEGGWANVQWDTFVNKSRHRNKTKESGPTIINQISAPMGKSVQNDPQVLHVMKGNFTNLPPMPTNTVRIFLSSTFSDFKAERNILPKKAYPELQQFCQALGLDFQVVDMRWGVTDDMMNDHQVSSLCLREISICKQVSCGPHFVTLIGNRYGHRPFPSSIPLQEFETLWKIAEQEFPERYHILKKWFLLDENSLTPSYIIQPIQSILTNYTDTSNDDMRRKDRESWDEIQRELQTVLRNSAIIAVEEGKMDDVGLSRYIHSVTEAEITEGLLTAQDAINKSLCYVRKLEGLDQHLSHSKAGKFIDIGGNGVIDEEAKNLLDELKHHKIPSKMKEGIKKDFITEWKGHPLEESSDSDHQQYLEKFAEEFVFDMKALISRNIQHMPHSYENSQLYQETLHHCKFAVQKTEVFCGREDTLREIQLLYSKEQMRKVPIIVSGPSGSGKTAMLAKVAQSVKEWNEGETVTIIRFLGTSPESSTISSVLRSIVSQLCVILDYSLPSDDQLRSMGDIRRYLIDTMDMIGKMHERTNFIVILDSVDQLDISNGAHQMNWLPKSTPANVCIMVSMISDRYTCFENTQKKISDPDQFVTMKSLSENACRSISDAYLERHNRKITSEQQECISEALNNIRQPLFLKLVLDQARKWHSYTTVSAKHIPNTVQHCINALFEELEHTFGPAFVSHALGYLTCGKGGLSSIEMEDILSCDDEVLSEVYKYHDPPLEGIIRIPSLLWARLENSLEGYLTEKQVDGKTVMAWYHRQFWEVAETRFLLKVNKKHILHQTLADLFMQENGVRRTITLEQRNNKAIPDADRKVMPQQLNSQNKRKLNSLTYHLLHAGNYMSLTNNCLLSFRYLNTFIGAFGAKHLLNEYNALLLSHDELSTQLELALFRAFLESSFSALNFDHKLLPLYINLRLKEYAKDYKRIKMIVTEATIWLDGSKEVLLHNISPVNLTPVLSPLKFTIFVGYDGIMTPDERVVICNWLERYTSKAKIQAINLDTKDMVASVDVKRNSPIAISRSSEHFFFSDDEYLTQCEVGTGDVISKWLLNDQHENFIVKAMNISQNGRYIAVAAKAGRPKESTDKKWRAKAMIFLFDSISDHRIIATCSFHAKRFPEKVFFVDEDQNLLVITREGVVELAMPNLEMQPAMKSMKGIHSALSIIDRTSSSLVVAIEDKAGVQFGTYNIKTRVINLSQIVHTNEESETIIHPFGLDCKPGLSRVFMGSKATGESRTAYIWIFNRTGDVQWENVKHIPIGNGEWKSPSYMTMTKNWIVCLVGWSNGTISIIDIATKKETTVSGHGHAVQFMQCNEYSTLVSVGADHSLKVWNVDELLWVKEVRQVEGLSTELDSKEQVVSMAVTNDYVLTAGHLNSDGPKFWSMKDGMKMTGQTKMCNKLYNEAIKDMPVELDKRYHATIDLTQKYILFCRKKSDALYCVAFNPEDHKCLNAEFFTNSYCHLLMPHLITNKMFIAQDQHLLEIKMPEMLVSKRIGMPDITAERRVLFYKLAVTTDLSYAVMTNSAPVKETAKGQTEKLKYMEMFDLKKGSFMKRVNLPESTPRKLLQDSIYYLVITENAYPEICKPSSLKYSEGPLCQNLLYANQSLLSEDLTLGVELLSDHGVRVWKTDPIERLVTMRGHIAEVKCTHFSSDKRYLATGSYDCTSRLWDLTTGTQLCLFHAIGAIDGVLFTPNMQNLVIHHYSAPQRKRVIITEIKNIKKSLNTVPEMEPLQT